jgi:hypothetical protein
VQDDPRPGYDPRSWEDPQSASGEETSYDSVEYEGIDIPELGLFPETVQANAGDIRPRLSGVPRGGKSATDMRERAVPASDDTVVEVEITDNPPADAIP